MYRMSFLSDVIDVSWAESTIAKTKANPVDVVDGGAKVLYFCCRDRTSWNSTVKTVGHGTVLARRLPANAVISNC